QSAPVPVCAETGVLTTIRERQPLKAANRRLSTTILVGALACSCLFRAAHRQSDEEREAELKRRVIGALNLKSGDTAPEVGCGDGFYTLPLAHFLGSSGKVYAEDISDSQLGKLKQHLSEQRLANVEVIKGAVDDPQLPHGEMNAVLIVNAYHEMVPHESIL